MTDQEDDDANRRCIRSACDTIERFVQLSRSHMGPGGRADIINLAIETIESIAHQARQFPWPDEQARALAAARRDKSLQKVLKKAHRKTPI
ncbi:MAG: hypothetical protein KIT63_13440 [Rhodoferax sp.]|nr:hypothetical protein [Rhodoferax sp.]